MRKKILIATGVYPPESGGPATYTKLLEERLPALGFEVSVLPFKVVRHLPPGVRHVAYFFKCLEMARLVNVVYALDTVSVGLPAMLAAKWLGTKFVVRVPGDYAWEQGQGRFGVTDDIDTFQTKRYGFSVELLRRVQRAVVRGASAVVVPSRYMQQIVAHWGARAQVIYSSIDLTPTYQLPNIRPEGFLVVSSGRRVPWKGFGALERVVKREQSWRLVIAENLPRAEALGWVKAADVYVLNSTYEGLSHALIEAMALGTPVIATAVGGNPELITSGVEGLLVPPNSDDALYAAIKNVAGNTEAARARAEAARSRLKQFSIETTVLQIAELLKNI